MRQQLIVPLSQKAARGLLALTVSGRAVQGTGVMRKLTLKALLLVAVVAPSIAQAAPTPAQRCEADVELASAKFAQCRLTAEAKYSKSLDADKRTAALARCSEKLQQSFAKAVVRYGLNCTGVPVGKFDAYLKQCSDDAAAAAAGNALPDYLGDLAMCSADLATTASALATCEAGVLVARPLKTGQTTGYGEGSDGDLQVGVAQAYLDNGDGTITDTRTGLMWEKKSDDGSVHDKDNVYSWSSGGSSVLDGNIATAFLAELNVGFAGYADWRLPNLNELESIRILGASPTVSEAFNTCWEGCGIETCSCTVPNTYWSSSTDVHFPDFAFLVSFDSGLAYTSSKSYDGFGYARAVRGGS